VVKVEAGWFCQDFCGTVALVIRDLERSSDSPGPSVGSPTAGKANETNTFGESKARDSDAARPWRSAEQLVTEFPPLFSSCM